MEYRVEFCIPSQTMFTVFSDRPHAQQSIDPLKDGRSPWPDGSLWVAWIKKNVIGDKIFWTADFRNSGSWIWKRLISLRDIARPRIHCQVESGNEALFWHDNWTDAGPLIYLSGPLGPMVTEIDIMATVSQAVSNSQWTLPRGRHLIVRRIRDALTNQTPPFPSTSSDIFLWQNGLNDVPSKFSASKTWEGLNPHPPSVSWHAAVWFKQRISKHSFITWSVWFKQRISKHSFITWLIMRERLTTRDRLRSWGLQVPPECLLCGSSLESQNHLFFDCSFSRDVWSAFFTHRSLSPPFLIADIIQWVRVSSPNAKLKIICHIIFQAVLYFLWRERNSRLHSGTPKPVQILVKEIQLLLRAELSSLDQLSTRARNRLQSAPAN
ncbi:hypothetical protein Bca101_031208 [Brassica carinata]